MKFTIARTVLMKMIVHLTKGVGRGQPGPWDFRLFACGAMVFVEGNGVTAGMEALVMGEGTCTLPRLRFLDILKSFAPQKNLTVEVEDGWLRINRYEMRVADYSPRAVFPAGFQPFPVTPNWIEVGDADYHRVGT